MDSLEYSSVFKEDRGALSHGKFKVSPQAIYFKNSKTGKVENIKSEDIKEINWQRIALEYGIRISLKNGSFYRFGGFHDYDFDKLSKYCEENYKIDLRQKDICLKGYNWGVANFNGSLLSFDQDKATCFEIPLTNVSHCASAKNEVTLEFHQNDDAPVSLMEIRFHIPTQQDSIVDDPVQAFMDAVADKASIIQATGESICTFSELYCLTPRGRYDIKIFPTFIQLHGKTFDYKIPLTSILRLFRLPHKDQRQVFFVLSLDPPIKQGQTRYQFLILLFSNDEEITLDVTLTDELKEKYEGKIEERMSGYTVDVLGQVMKVLVQRKITQPGIQTANPAISCSYKAAAGYLYPLERGFMFVHKPPVHIRFDEITAINFARSGGSTRSFDFEVETKSSVTHTFSSIEKDEYSKLYDFVTSKNLRVKNRGTEKQKVDVDDDDLVDSDMEGEPDAYLQRVKNEGKLREQDDSEDDESEDEDFRPGEESDVEEEYDSDVKSSSGSSDEEADSGKDSDDSRKRKMKKQKHSKEKKHKKEKTSKKSSKKSKDDDGKPKKPMTAYFIWMNENRSSIKSKYPDLSVTEFSKKAGEIWKEKLSPEEKAIYEKKSEKAKEEYQKAMQEYNKKTGGPSKSSSSGDKSKKSAPKESKNESPKKFKSAEYIATSSESSSSSSSDSD